MIEEYTTYQTKCDACGKIKIDPTAIAGHYDSGWREVDGKDLCDVCYGMFMIDVMIYLEEHGITEDLLDIFITKTKDETNSTNSAKGNAFGLNAEEIEKFKKELQKSITDEIERNKFEYPGFPVYKEYPRDPLMPIPDGTGCPPMPNTPNTCDKIYLSNIDGIQFSYTPNILN